MVRESFQQGVLGLGFEGLGLEEFQGPRAAALQGSGVEVWCLETETLNPERWNPSKPHAEAKPGHRICGA